MKQQHINTQLLKKITKDIMAKAPRGRWYGRLVSAARVSLVMLLFFAASFAMSFFLYDLGEKISIFEFTNSPIIENMTNFLFEFLVIALLGIGGIYIVYRQTDWPLVKERFWLFIGSFIFVASLSIGLVIFSESSVDPWGDFIGETTHSISRTLPFRSEAEERMENDMDENFYFAGTIIPATTSDDDTITIQSSSLIKSFNIEDDISAYEVGSNVIVHYVDEQDGSDPVIKEIKKL